MSYQGAINMAKGYGYFIQYSRNPKGYEVARYCGDEKEIEYFGTYDDCMNKLAELGYQVAEIMMGI